MNYRELLLIGGFICLSIIIFGCNRTNSLYSIGKTYVVIGASAAGRSAIKKLTDCASLHDRIAFISKEAEFYDRTKLKSYIKKLRSPVLSSPKNGKIPIEFIHNTVKSINSYDKKVICSDD